MFISTFKKRLFFNFFFVPIILFFIFFYFKEIFTSNYILIDFAIHPFNICENYIDLWNFIKISYIFFVTFSTVIIINLIYSFIFSKQIKKSNISSASLSHSELNLIIGKDKNTNEIILEENGLYQNILITGTIGTGKTSSAMYPFTEQLLKFKANFPKEKLGMLVLDVKGNYHSQVKKYCENTIEYMTLWFFLSMERSNIIL